MNELYKIHSFYKFSLDSFIIVVQRAINIVAEQMNPKKKKKEEGEAEEGEEGAEDAPEEEEEEQEAVEMSPKTLEKRVNALTESITYQGFNYARRGTLEADKMILATMLCFRIGVRHKLISASEVDSLVRKEVALDPPHQPDALKFIPESIWPAIKGLESIKTFEHVINQMEGEALQWRKWYQEGEPEVCDLPRALKDISLFHRILLLRALRPDRLINALKMYVKDNMGEEYVEQPAFSIEATFAEMTITTPMFFVLFPGVDPTPEVEFIGQQNGKKISDGTFINISMGQG
jgi:dynein heavy chain